MTTVTLRGDPMIASQTASIRTTIPPVQPFVYIVSSALSNLPKPGNRVGPSDAANMAKIVASGSNIALTTSNGAHHYRFVGIEFAPPAGVAITGSLLRIGNGGETSLSQFPSYIFFDRCYIHGDATLGGRRGIQLNGASVAVIDSYLSDWKDTDTGDAHTIGLWNSPGPIKFVNNYLEGSGEGSIFGGSDPTGFLTISPSDVEIRRNYYNKPSAWRTVWTVKNSFELKHSVRSLIEGNIFNNSWVDGQDTAINIKSVNQNGGATYSVTKDFTFRKNIVRHVGNAIKVCGKDCDGLTTAQGMNYQIDNNIWDDVSDVNWGDGSGNGNFLQGLGNTPSMVVDHNTVINDGNTFLGGVGSGASTAFVFTNNIVSSGTYGFKGGGTPTGTATLDATFGSYTVTKNALVGTDFSAQYPAGNFWPAAYTNVGFTDYAGGNYLLTGGSSYHNAGLDGKDLGADIAAVNAATLHTVDGQWGSEPPTYSTAAGAVAEIPRTFLDTTYRAQTGATVHVNSFSALQAAVNNAKLGDTIVVDITGSYTGTLNLPAK